MRARGLLEGKVRSKRLERLCRYITLPALSEERIQVNTAGQVQLELKALWRDGTTHPVLSPLEFLQRLAALVHRPRLHLIRYHGVLAPNARVSGTGGAAGAARSGARGHRGSGSRRVQASRAGAGPGAKHRLGAVAQARVRHRPVALPELRRRGAQDHRGDPATGSDREAVTGRAIRRPSSQIPRLKKIWF